MRKWRLEFYTEMNSEKVTQNFLKTYKMKQLSSEKQKKRENENYLLRNL